jgi:hypothetical protein
MSIRKKLLAVAAVSALTAATAVPALALENEFHGMYRFSGYQTNFFNGATFVGGAAAAAHLKKDANSGFFAEQRARIQYIAKANDNLKLVTHFELDTRFGGTVGPYKGINASDAGQLDADNVTLETKNVFLDFNCPITGTNVKAGIQPWVDSYQALFLLADMTGVYATKKFGPATASLGWFRFNDQTVGGDQDPGKKTNDLIVLDGKFAINKDITVGASYYNVSTDTATAPAPAFELLHMIGANAAMKFGPAAINAFAAYQFGEFNKSANTDLAAYLLGATAKVKVGKGAVNAAAFYRSGDGDLAAGDRKDFQNISAVTSYFPPASMWLLVRSNKADNSSTSVLGTDNSVGGRGMIGVFAGYEGTVDKLFYNANIGYGMAAEERGNEDGSLGTEINAQVGYKMYDNLSASVAAAYMLLGKGLNDTGAKKITGFGAADADDPYMINVQLTYTF